VRGGCRYASPASWNLRRDWLLYCRISLLITRCVGMWI